MAVTSKPIESATAVATYTVLRAICIAGERVEVGDSVELTRSQYNEAAAAGKVGPYVPKADKPAKAAKASKAAPDSTATQGTEPTPDEAQA